MWSPLARCGCALGFAASLAACSGGSGSSAPSVQPTQRGSPTAQPSSGPAAPSPLPSASPNETAAWNALLPPTPVPNGVYEPRAPDVTLAPVTLPLPFNPSSPLSSLGRTNLPNSYVRQSATPGFDRFRSARARPMSIAGANDHESWGISLESASSSYTAFYAVQTGYESTQNPLTHPAGVIGTEQTFSPTIREGGNCLEDSTFYANDNVTQSALFTVFSFCLAQPNFIFTTPIASAFVSQYEGRLPN